MFNENTSKLDDIQRWHAMTGRFVDQLGVAAMDDDDTRYRTYGADIARVFPVLLAYLRHDAYMRYVAPPGGQLSGRSGNCYLTPTYYSASMAPVNLGLAGPVDVCLVIDTARIPVLIGPGTAPAHPNAPFSGLWSGGGIEFRSPSPIPNSHIVDVLSLQPFGERHRR